MEWDVDEDGITIQASACAIGCNNDAAILQFAKLLCLKPSRTVTRSSHPVFGKAFRDGADRKLLN